jgi:drug/metabolite transporter (DMT)-like permease
VPVLFALLAALANALNVITQHVASIGDPQGRKGWRFVRYLVANPLWLFGWVALAAAFVFQAVALHNGAISEVQPLLVTELVFALVLRRVWIHQRIRAVTWWAAAVTCAALGVFLAMAEPSGGSAEPTTGAWLSASLATAGTAGLLAVLGRRGSPARRAALLGASASILWALVAVFIKATTDTLSVFGVAGMFTHWPVYALAVAGLVAELLNQAALHLGPLSVSQPVIVIVDPIVSIALSIWIFGEMFSENAATLAVASLAFATMCAAVIVLTRTAPATMDPEAAPPGPVRPTGGAVSASS